MMGDPALGQFFTPSWAAEALMRRHFPGLTSSDTVLEPSCGDGRFLMAVPDHVDAYGVEIDPKMAARAIRNSMREVICGDFLQVDLPRKPTVVIGNPPYRLSLIEQFLERCYEELDYEGRVGFLLPVYVFQTAHTVLRMNQRWSISQELIPRNIFEGMQKPLMFATFRKERRTVLSGFFLYEETASLEGLKQTFRKLIWGNASRAGAWQSTIEAALTALGGEATLEQLYDLIETDRPTPTRFWREQIRKVAAQRFERVGPGRYALPEVA